MKVKGFKEKFIKTINRLENEAVKTIVDIQTGNFAPPTKEDRIALTVSAAVGALGYGTSCSFAATGLFDQVESLVGEFYGKFFGLTTKVAALCAIIAILLAMFNPKERGAAFAWSWLKRIVGCWLLINVLGGLFAVGERITAGQNFTPTT